LLEPGAIPSSEFEDGYEFFDGENREKRVGAKSERIAGAVLSVLRNHLRSNRIGWVYGSNTSYRGCFPHEPLMMRKPDVSFVPFSKMPAGEDPDGDFRLAPDLAVDVVSPGDSYGSVEQKVFDYRQAGVKLIWIVSPPTKTVLIRRLDGSCSEVDVRGTLSGEDVVPGFECAVAELFE